MSKTNSRTNSSVNIGDVVQYQGRASFTGKMVRVLSVGLGIAHIAVIDRQGNNTSTTAWVYLGWLAEKGKSSDLRKLDYALRKRSAEIKEVNIKSFGIESTQGELEL